MDMLHRRKLAAESFDEGPKPSAASGGGSEWNMRLASRYGHEYLLPSTPRRKSAKSAGYSSSGAPAAGYVGFSPCGRRVPGPIGYYRLTCRAAGAICTANKAAERPRLPFALFALFYADKSGMEADKTQMPPLSLVPATPACSSASPFLSAAYGL